MLSKKESQGVFIVSFTKHLKNSHPLFQETEEEMFMPFYQDCVTFILNSDEVIIRRTQAGVSWMQIQDSQ